jgi:hypothetical protein
MKIVPFEPSHLGTITPQRSQVVDLLCSKDAVAESTALANSGPAITGMHDGEVIFCAGSVKQWEGRHIIWSIMSHKAGKHMFGIVKSIKRLIPLYAGLGRMEVVVRADFPEGCRLIEKFFGFTFHHYEEKFLPGGADARIYVRYL